MGRRHFKTVILQRGANLEGSDAGSIPHRIVVSARPDIPVLPLRELPVPALLQQPGKALHCVEGSGAVRQETDQPSYILLITFHLYLSSYTA